MLNVAVVGIGWWGPVLITLMKKSPNFKVVKGVKRNPATVADFAREQGIEVRDKAHPSTPAGWTLTKVVSGDTRASVEYSPASSVAANLEAFADAVEGRAPYLVTQEEMIANIAALEAIIESAKTGDKVAVR